MTHGTMLDAHPKRPDDIDSKSLAERIEACFEGVKTCTTCADSCLSEDMVADLTTCIRTDLDCADVCATTGKVLSRHAGDVADLARALLETCEAACKACGDECAQHADMHEHCKICAEACRRCENSCRALIDVL